MHTLHRHDPKSNGLEMRREGIPPQDDSLTTAERETLVEADTLFPS